MTDGATNSWNEIVRGGTFTRLPTSAVRQCEEETATAVEERRRSETATTPTASGPAATKPATPLASTEKEVQAKITTAKRRVKAITTKHKQRKHSSTTRAPSTSIEPTNEAIAHDCLGIFDVPGIPVKDRKKLTELISQPKARRRGGPLLNQCIAAHGGDSVSKHGFLTLNEGMWLNDKVLSYTAKQVLLPTSVDCHCFSSFFFTRLLRTGYNFNEVHRWSNRIPGGIQSLQDLYVPINKDGNHWLLLKVNLPQRTIQLWDSLGIQSTNRLYLDSMLRYLYNDSHRTGSGDVTSFEAWA